jgi:hypothetical protein
MVGPHRQRELKVADPSDRHQVTYDAGGPEGFDRYLRMVESADRYGHLSRGSWREIEGESVVLDMRSSTYFRTNRSGTLLLRALVEGCQRDELVNRVVAAYGLGTDRAAADVDGFIAELARRGLLDDAN